MMHYTMQIHSLLYLLLPNWPYDRSHYMRLDGRLLQTCGPAVAKVMSPKSNVLTFNNNFPCFLHYVIHRMWCWSGDFLSFCIKMQ